MPSIGNNIRRLREERGYTQAELATMAGVGEKYISAIERGARDPGKKIMAQLCDALAVDEQTARYGERKVYEDEDLRLLQEEVARAFQMAKADSPLKKHHFMSEMLGKLKALHEEGREKP